MKKIEEIIIGTNNLGKFNEISTLLPNWINKYSPKDFDIPSPKETGKTYKENSRIKAEYFSKKTNLICISDDSGLEINALNGAPGIYSSRWSGKKNNFNLAIKKIFLKLKKNKNWEKFNKAKFICSLSIYWPSGKIFSSQGIIRGTISNKKRGKKGFGYDPIFTPNGFKKTFGELDPKLKMSIDHRYIAFTKIKKFFF
jgi:XTP/dITP diphosphohydrolase